MAKKNTPINPACLPARVIARLWGVTPQAVGLWASKEGCPRNADGSYDLRAVIAWRERRLVESSAVQQARADYERARAAEKELDNRLKQLKLERQRQLVVPEETVAADLARKAMQLRRLIETAGKRFGTRVKNFLVAGLRDMRMEDIQQAKKRP